LAGLDAFSHALEAYTTILATPMTDLICEKIMQTVAEYLPTTVENGDEIEARTKMQMALAQRVLPGLNAPA